MSHILGGTFPYEREEANNNNDDDDYDDDDKDGEASFVELGVDVSVV